MPRPVLIMFWLFSRRLMFFMKLLATRSAPPWKLVADVSVVLVVGECNNEPYLYRSVITCPPAAYLSILLLNLRFCLRIRAFLPRSAFKLFMSGLCKAF